MDQLKQELTKRLVRYLDVHSLWAVALHIFIGAILCVGAGGFIYWMWKRHKIKAETQKILRETEKTAVEIAEKKVGLLKQVYEYRDASTRHSETLSLALRLVFEAMRERDPARTDASREEAIRLFFTDVVEAFAKYAEVSLACLSRKERARFVVEEIFSFLETSIHFLSGVNYPALLSVLRRSPATADRRTWSRLFAFADDNLPIWYLAARRKCGRLKVQLAAFER